MQEATTLLAAESTRALWQGAGRLLPLLILLTSHSSPTELITWIGDSVCEGRAPVASECPTWFLLLWLNEVERISWWVSEGKHVQAIVTGVLSSSTLDSEFGLYPWGPCLSSGQTQISLTVSQYLPVLGPWIWSQCFLTQSTPQLNHPLLLYFILSSLNSIYVPSKIFFLSKIFRTRKFFKLQ